VCSARGQGIGHQSFDDRGLGISWPPTLLLALIHRSAWNRNSPKFAVAISPALPRPDALSPPRLRSLRRAHNTWRYDPPFAGVSWPIGPRLSAFHESALQFLKIFNEFLYLRRNLPTEHFPCRFMCV
jgi:hypothetical protein